MQGLRRLPSDARAFSVPLCLVPAGSGNGIAASCGLWTPATAAHAMLHGALAHMDAATVIQPGSGTRLLSVMSLQYGMLADLDIGTEHLRGLLGGERFTYGAIREILRWHPHRAKVAWVTPEAFELVAQRTRGAAKAGTKPCAPSSVLCTVLTQLFMLGGAEL